MTNKDFKKKAHEKLTGQGTLTPESIKDAVGKAAKGDTAPLDRLTDRVIHGDPWDGKRRLDAPTKSLRVAFTETEIAERRVDLEKRLAQTPHLRDQVSAASDALKAAKAKLTSHIAENEAFSAITKQGWQYQDVECIEVHEQRPGGYNLAVTYRTDTGEEVSKREMTAAELQESIPGA